MLLAGAIDRGGSRSVHGEVTFTVLDTRCGLVEARDGPPPAPGGYSFPVSQADGQFCKVTVEAQNRGSRPAWVCPEEQFLVVAGQAHAPASGFMATDFDDQPLWHIELNPGGSHQGYLLFDVPAGATPKSVEFRDCSATSGRKVRL